MGILLAFSPFLAFVLVTRLVSGKAGFVAGALTSAALLARDAFSRGRSPKILEIGTLVLFAGLAVYAILASPAWSIAAVRLRVDGGLLLVVLLSIALRKPFTLQYAREQVAREAWDSPTFLRVNYVITAVWAAAFALMAAIDLLLLDLPGMPRSAAILATVAAIWGAAHFTSWYPARQGAAALPPAPAPLPLATYPSDPEK